MKKIKKNPHVIQLLEVFENKTTVFMVMEYASNGDLLNYIKGKP